jgi:hypothetical protein
MEYRSEMMGFCAAAFLYISIHHIVSHICCITQIIIFAIYHLTIFEMTVCGEQANQPNPTHSFKDKKKA